MCSEGALALLVDLEALAELTSLGTLVTFFCTAAALLWRRYCDGSPASMRSTALRLACIIAASLGEPVSGCSRSGRAGELGKRMFAMTCEISLTAAVCKLAHSSVTLQADLTGWLCLQCSALLRCLALRHGLC